MGADILTLRMPTVETVRRPLCCARGWRWLPAGSSVSPSKLISTDEPCIRHADHTVLDLPFCFVHGFIFREQTRPLKLMPERVREALANRTLDTTVADRRR